MDFTCARGSSVNSFKERFEGKGLGRQAELDFANIIREQYAHEVLVDHLVQNTGMYNSKIAALLCAASTWAYSDADTMARMMSIRGIPNNETASVRLQNSSLFLDTTVHVVQSEGRELVIVCFGGTQITNMIQMFLDFSARTDSFFSTGSVHGGIFRGFMALWPNLKIRLKATLLGYSNCLVTALNVASHDGNPNLGSLDMTSMMSRRPMLSGIVEDGLPVKGREKMQALYIAGHSLGGALAVLAAAAIHMDPTLAPLKERLRGVYTFGQVMVGDDVFARAFTPMFEDRLFRHVYKNDLVPHLPPRTMGRFAHFGREYWAPSMNWELQQTSSDQVWIGGWSLMVGAGNLIKDQFSPLRRLPTLHRLAYSLGDHSPLNYLRTSLQSAPGSEFAP